MSQAVLVVEDNPITRKMVRIALASEGYDVLEADTVDGALAAAPRADLILQDLALGEIDGFELIGRMREISRSTTPILAFTGLRDEARVRAAGFADLVLKPVEPTRLIEVVRAHLGAGPPAASTHDATASDPTDRRWRALEQLIARIATPDANDEPQAQVTESVLGSFLDVTGLSIGAAFERADDGTLMLTSQLGFSRLGASRLANLCGHPSLLSAVAVGRPVAMRRTSASWTDRLFLYGLGMTAALIVPMMLGEQVVGVLVLASANPEISGEWLELAKVVAAPCAQAVVLAGAVARLAASEHRFRGIADAIDDGIVVADGTGAIVFANPAVDAMLGAGVVAVGNRIVDAIPLVATGSRRGQLDRADGEPLPVEIRHRPGTDRPGGRDHVYVIRDLSTGLRLDEYARLANQDMLTGLSNRRRFEEAFEVELTAARRYGTTGSVILLDLDRFKPVNDDHGHAAGDAVLVAVGAALALHTRESDLPARLGGDEFAILLRRTDPEGALACAEKIVARLLELEVRHAGRSLSVGATAGVATFPADGHTVAAVLSAADAALYRGKQRGRGRVVGAER